jgi:hypothetical protein
MLGRPEEVVVFVEEGPVEGDKGLPLLIIGLLGFCGWSFCAF